MKKWGETEQTVEGTSQRHWRKCEHPGKETDLGNRETAKQLLHTDREGDGTGEHSVEYWENKHNSDIQIMASGGNMDWAPGYARSNTRAEQTHILAAMIQLYCTQ
jgi:hypothetical protein